MCGKATHPAARREAPQKRPGLPYDVPAVTANELLRHEDIGSLRHVAQTGRT